MARQIPAIVGIGLVVSLVLIGLIVGIAVLGAVGTTTAEESTSPPAGPDVWFTVELDEDGDAHWSIAYRFGIDTEEEAAAFEQLADAVRAGEVDLPVTKETMNAYLADAESTVDREMSITDTTWTDRVAGDVGTLTLEFVWQDFGTTSDQTLTIGDAFYGQEGLWFKSLGEDARLTIEAPDGYELQAAPPNATVDDNTLTWNGPHTFESASFDLEYVTDERATLPVSWDILALILILLALSIGIGFGYWKRHRTPTSQPSELTETEEEIDEELLSDPERVERLLIENGGRMKQAKIVEDTGWSSAKVSQLLSEMADEGRVQKLRIGQENLISLPSEEEENDSTD